MSSCSSPRYLPAPDKIDINEYGSFIEIKGRSGNNLRGELIAIDSNHIVVLSEKLDTCVFFRIYDVSTYSLKYAKSKDYTWAMATFTGGSIIHGFGLIFTLPMNLAATSSIQAAEQNAYKYNDKLMSLDKLKMFARFPQGIPSSVNISSIKNDLKPKDFKKVVKRERR